MPAAFPRSEVERIAALANLELTEAELALFSRQLGDILEYANQVREIDTTGVPPTAAIAGSRPAERDDVAAPSLPRDAALADAPDANQDAGLFKVPRIIG